MDHSKLLTAGEIQKLVGGLSQWRVSGQHHLERTFLFEDFVTALEFVNVVGTLAEEHQHHPEIVLSWGKVEITLWTHSVGGLTLKDFKLAEAIDLASR